MWLLMCSGWPSKCAARITVTIRAIKVVMAIITAKTMSLVACEIATILTNTELKKTTNLSLHLYNLSLGNCNLLIWGVVKIPNKVMSLDNSISM